MQLSHSIQMMGTTIDILIDSDTPKEHISEVCRLLTLYKNRFSANDADSELMVINDNSSIAPVTVHPDLFDLIAIGKKHSLATPSNLNIAIGPLVQSWRIGFDDARVPSPQKIQKALALSKPENIILDATKQSVFLSQKGMKIDLGALAKGYIADKIMDYLKSEKVTSAMINLGGNVLVYGDNPRNDKGIWRIGIQNPQKPRGKHIGILTLKNQSVVTSGIYERRLKVGNKEYHHIFDQKTGYPIDTEMASLTILSELSVDCEIWTTRLFGLPVMQALATIQATPRIEGILITKDNRLALTNGLRSNFQLLR
ncbi:iron-sulfur cluster assembly/repair protein [Streptococcus infantarius subsp. infantarius]|uniref:FAD:protein FMN transferase n=2 Tax=Streptococcus infantarius TaxID=102684 RepID=A0A380KNI6_9STRE|nr:FAD:protein FMN transferase [Streptococcus infantarius]AEZ62173.1 iron-sulfur cluster assembly/repair protein [Streptococcus infantarius subsp. infantarius CJ18]MCO4488617.1 iron-sulfur cluster assembly/repair protein [Streptococcus infantarius subsp. infantarius]EDT47396.1 ApbE family protein [Streptococcus infantarius subsp. infantarius ATCC BAA-102]MCO4489798.1 iron-sulfur cluster assembly/repair protein [Streptococcus infantarius subsp. infantarius]MCO4492107.1 iron-sulfur cluster assem